MGPADFTAKGINAEKVASGKNDLETQLAGPSWENLGKLIHESGEWYGWASPFQVIKLSRVGREVPHAASQQEAKDPGS